MSAKTDQLPRVVRNCRRGKKHEQWMAEGWKWHPRLHLWYLRERLTADQRREQQSLLARLEGQSSVASQQLDRHLAQGIQ